ncbi:MAG TPA: ribosomal protein S18-alanine N-acetyltransferase [Acidiferrobacter sp.]|nr:ribosomal protein S18-alanine N-acetyltransferase [Acidiferrobacter sp.]
MSGGQLPAQAEVTPGCEPVLRPMRPEDLPFVMQVEHMAYEFPWTEGIFRDCLRVGYCARVLEDRGRLAGHGVMVVTAGECHLLNVCVHPHYQRRGLGRQLLAHLLDVAREGRAKVALLEVRRSNEAAYALYSQLGFNEIGLRKNYYPGRRGREDALVLARDL